VPRVARRPGGGPGPGPRSGATIEGLPSPGLPHRLLANLEAVHGRIGAARARGAHAAAEVALVAVTKAVPPALFPTLARAGVREVGENRVQAALARRPLAPADWVWHGIGHLQRNKAARALEAFDVFHALDSRVLAERLEALLAPRGRRWSVYLQVNAAGDPRKGGVGPEDALTLFAEVARLPHLEPLGFMTLAAEDGDEDDTRRTFRILREIRDEALRRGTGPAPPRGLSMGMSNDFEIAVEEGATVVRVGSALFEGLAATGPGGRA
jgi:pyridoxal phosphate enzyme (YggS family)